MKDAASVIYRTIAAEGKLSDRDLIAIGMTPGQVANGLKVLLREGKVERADAGTPALWRVTTK